MNSRIARAFALADLLDKRATECPGDTDPVEWCRMLETLAIDFDFDLVIYINKRNQWAARQLPDRRLSIELRDLDR